MKITTFLLLIITVMHVATIINITLFNGEWNGIVMTLNSILFILAIGVNAMSGKRD
ncbi:hypothetical protein LC040_03185 [Bacillus tianshenii]|nr:hypothetical protein LC040_03185 [Bacillus tianshenii]